MKSIIKILLALIIVSCSGKQEENNIELKERIARIENGLRPNLQIQGESIPNYNIEERLKDLGIPGVSIAVISNGEIDWAKGYGIADSTENRPVTKETLFLAGSISKPIAATRIHQLVERGIVNLDSNVNKYLSSWKLPENEFTSNEKVTTRRILNHTAGLTVWGFPGYDKGDTIPTIPEILDGKGNTDSVRVYKQPGESWMYSGGGYTIMQLMITDLEEQPFPEIMQSNVLNPLGMEKSTFKNPLPKEYHSLAATGYRTNGDEVEGKWPIYPEMAAAGLWTTPSQLILWAREIQKIQQNQKNGLLQVETVNEMLKPGMNNHGLGPVVNEYTFGHGGADEGFRAEMLAWKNSAHAVVIMVNSDNRSIIQEILLSIAKEYELPGIEPDRRSIVPQTEEQRNRFTGNYSIPRFGEVSINIKDNGLEAIAEFSKTPIFLLPESETVYFNKDNGAYFEFLLKDDTVIGFEYGRIKAEKLK
jgi:CubicO group peptidase (beta-lactamase class C family)